MKSSYIWAAGGAAAAVVLILVVLVSLSSGGKDTASESTAVSSARQKDEQQRRKKLLLRAKAELRKCRQEEAANPRAYSRLKGMYMDVLSMSLGLPKEFRKKVNSRLTALDRLHRNEGEKTLESLKKKLEELASDEERGYREACKLFEEVPPEIAGLPALEKEFLELKEKTGKLALKEGYLAALEKEALSFARKGYYRVAELIVNEGFTEGEFDSDSPFWERRNELLQKFETAAISKLIRKEQQAKAEARAKRLEKQQKALAERRKKFLAGKQKVEAKPLLGPYDLINWGIRSKGRDWKLTEEDGKGLLTAKPPGGGGPWLLGQYGPHWQDYALSFEFKLTSGKVIFYPRVRVKKVRGFPAGVSVPELSEMKKPVVFEAGSAGQGWVQATVDVYGGGDATTVKVNLSGGGTSRSETFKGSELKNQYGEKPYPDTGGFLFLIWEGSEFQLRNVEFKLIRHTRRGILS